MTAVNKKIKAVKTKQKISLPAEEKITAVAAAVLGFVAGRAVWADIPVGMLAMVLIYAVDDSLQRPALAAGRLASFGIMAVKDIIYIPHMLAVIIYAVIFSSLKKEKAALCFSLAIYTVAGVLFAGDEGLYRLFVPLQAVAIWRLAAVADSGKEIYNPDSGHHTLTDMLTVMVTAVVFTVCLSGGDSHWLYLGTAFSLAMAWVYAGRNSLLYSLIAFVCCAVSLTDKRAFVTTFCAVFALWLGAIFAAEKSRTAVYPVAGGLALLINLRFLPQLNSFALTGTALMALVFFTVIPHICSPAKLEKPELFTGDKDWRQLMMSMQKLENSLNYLGSCAIDISRLNDKNYSVQSLEDAVAEDVCRGCSHSSYCWQERYSFTSRQFSRYAKSLHWQNRQGFEMGFYSQCVNIEGVKKSFEENSRLLLSKKYILQTQKNNQHLLQGAFMSIAAAVGDLLSASRRGSLVNASVTMQMDRFLTGAGLMHGYCLCTQKPDRIVFSLKEPAREPVLNKIKHRAQELYDEKFSPPQMEKQAAEYVYSLQALPAYSYIHRAKSRAYREVNGDNYIVKTIEDNLYVIISDGMGTGAAAAAESKTVLAMADSLLSAGISADNAVNIVNLAMNLRGSGEGGATLDMLKISLTDGRAVLTKAGGGPTLVIGHSGLVCCSGDSLPLGVVKDIKLYTEEFTITPEDTVIMATDGVGEINGNIRNLYSQSCEEIAAYIINENKTNDDKTALAVRLVDGKG